MPFVARKAELRAIEDLLRATADGRGGSLVITGEPGMGKSALIDAAIDGLDDWLVLRANGTEFERDLPYAGLHQLCMSVLEYRAGLPPVQRKALESVFGLGDETTPNRLMVSVAVLGLLNELAQERPVCCVVDDVQWIDAGTRQSLGFVARRIAAERVAMVLAERRPRAEAGFGDLPQLPLPALNAADARTLLSSARTERTQPDEEVLDRILAEAGGNPLALLEFGLSTGPLGLPADTTAGRLSLSITDPVTDRSTAGAPDPLAGSMASTTWSAGLPAIGTTPVAGSEGASAASPAPAVGSRSHAATRVTGPEALPAASTTPAAEPRSHATTPAAESQATPAASATPAAGSRSHATNPAAGSQAAPTASATPAAEPPATPVASATSITSTTHTDGTTPTGSQAVPAEDTAPTVRPHTPPVGNSTPTSDATSSTTSTTEPPNRPNQPDPPDPHPTNTPLTEPASADDTIVGALTDRFTRRVQQLPADVRHLVVLAAAEPVGDLGLVRRAARLLGLDPARLAVAEDQGLLSLGPQLRFRFPLVRSSAYQSATPGVRRQVHAALADATDPETSADRRAWHRAHSVVDTDEDVAEELVRSAGRAQRRSGLAAASAFLERAAELTPDPVRQGRRLLAAARARLDSGAPAKARELLAQAERRPLEPEDRAEARQQNALIAFHLTRSPEATAALVEAAVDLPLDRARETYLEAFSTSMFIDRLPGRLRRLGAQIRAQAPTPAQPRPVDLLLDALLAQALIPAEEAIPVMQQAVSSFRTAASPWWMDLACMMALDLGDTESAELISARQVELARAQGAFSLLPQALRFHAIARTAFGRFRDAAASIEEANAVDEAAGTVSLAFAELILAGWRGDEDQLTEVRDTLVHRIGRVEAVAELYGTIVLYNGIADYPAALEAGIAAQRQEEQGSYVVWNLDQELVEAAARTGRPEVASAALTRLEARARLGRTPWAIGKYLVSQALLDPDSEHTDQRYRDAIDSLAPSQARVDYGRARLVYGEWLRREGRRAEARAELQAAHETLSIIGATGFAGRAARELLATGQRPRREGKNPLDLLTAQERLIVGKVAAGATSKEVAAELFLSPRTIDTHLRNSYRKLGISSRRQLRELPL
ncbi:LuxR family transcriptional regulator [Amycolatopsis jejuensis]|uniref:AAA family ATPase n=1 Tax=Amycolatopsis jejuensis TaxID=330084 RepID=UPI00068BD161|nr:LuxR family transcriptional regulator [Amycolatopsis jejuensis]